MVNKIYLIKNLTPWMMDELLAFSAFTKFTVVFIRAPGDYHRDSLQKLGQNNIRIIIKPFSYKQFFNKALFVFSFFFTHFRKFLIGYNFVIGWKSLFWFIKLDLSIFQAPSNIHAQFATQPAIIAFMLKKYFKQNVEYSFTSHAYDIYFRNKWFTVLLNESQIAFSISNYNIQYIKDNYKNISDDKIKLSRLGVLIPKKISSKNKINRDKIVIGFLSWFVGKKGIKYLLEAIRIIYSKYSNNFKFILAGDGPLKDEITSFIRINKLENFVSYIGRVEGEVKQKFFSSLDAFILPSITLENDMDGIPVVLMEAISYGLPIISTNISGIPELCINNFNGYLISEKNIDEIIAAVLNLKDADLRQKYSVNSLKIAKEYDLLSNSKHKILLLKW